MSHPALAQNYAPTPFTPSAAALAPRRYGQPAASPFATQAARYRDAELQSATPGQLVVMLFDKMLLTLRRARIACEAKQIEVRCEQIVKAAEMIGELRVSLDHKQGGDISKQLDALYGFMLRELYEANRTQDAGKIDVVIRMASELRDAFSQVVTTGAGAPSKARSA
jgi:flagellar protein FliS